MEDDNSEASVDAEADDLDCENGPVPDEAVMTPTPPFGGLDATRADTYPSATGQAHPAQTPRAGNQANATIRAEHLDDTTLTPNARTAQPVAE